MRKVKYFFLFFLCLASYAGFAQGSEIDELIAQMIAAFVENSGEEGDFDFNTLYEEYENLQKSPLDLNSATRSDLQEIFFLSEIEISNILDHRAKLGDFKAIYELQTIPGLSLPTIRLLKEISMVSRISKFTPVSFRSRLAAADHTVYLKWKQLLQQERGFRSIDGADPKYLGSPDHLYLRYKMNVGNDIKMGFIAEKDAGEPFYYPGKIYGADYFSFHFYAKDLTNSIRFLALGDYAINLGQGLVMHNGFGGGKSSLTTSIRKGGYPVRAYSSVSELNFLRGGALTLRLGKRWEWTNFASSRFRNGGVVPDADDPFTGDLVSSLPLGGLNRTEAEIARKRTIRQSTLGSSLKYRFKKGHIAAQAVGDLFNATLTPNGQLYQLFYPNSNTLVNASVDYGYNWRNFNFFGETAWSSNQAIANLHGVLIGLDKKMDFVMAYRNYDKSYLSLTANAFGESTLGINEEGFYMGLEFRPAKGWIINAFTDHWRNPWLRFRVDAPGSGKEYFLKIKYFKKRTWEIYGQYFHEDKLRNSNGRVDFPVNNLRQRFRLHGSVKLNKSLEIRNRAEFSWYTIPEIRYLGFMVYQDLIYKPVGKNYSFNYRYAFFDIEDFDGRIYTYENDILNEYYIPAFNGRGIRFYVNTRTRVTRHLTFELRYEITRLSQAYRDEDGAITNIDFGSGNTEILGRSRSRLKAQIKYKF